MQISSKKKYGGFTLIELSLYIVIMGICVLAISSFLNLINNAKIKNRLIAEVEQQGDQISSIIRKNILDSSGINNPLPGSTGTTLSLSFLDTNRNPTIFSTDVNGNITIKIGTGQVINLNNNFVQTENLSFSNLSRINTRGNINTQFIIRTKGVETRSEYLYAQHFNLTTSRR